MGSNRSCFKLCYFVCPRCIFRHNYRNLNIFTLILILLGITAYKGVVSLKGVAEVEKANYGTIIGILITLATGLFSFLVNYLFFSNKATGNNFFVIVAGAIGGYLAERKLRLSKTGVVDKTDSKSHWLKVVLVGVGIFIALLVVLVVIGSLASKK